ncbi:MAG: phosphonate C-P lyase system protein PhnH [Pseudomonadota bacterium]
MVALFQSGDLIRQRVFRVILDAVSRPGRICQMPGATHRQDRFACLFMVLETLLDQEATHCMIGEDGAAHLEPALYEATKSPPAALKEADFIIAPYGSTKGGVSRAKRGLPEYPDLSATVVYRVDYITRERDAPVKCSLRGPGILDSLALPTMEGFDHRELLQLCAVNRDFPLGVDALFVDPAGRIVALPRSTQIQVKEPQWHMSQ